MRVIFEFLTPNKYNFSDREINDFPCRLNDGDVITADILGVDVLKAQKEDFFGNFTIESVLFDIDEKGLYQRAWLEFDD